MNAMINPFIVAFLGDGIKKGLLNWFVKTLGSAIDSLSSATGDAMATLSASDNEAWSTAVGISGNGTMVAFCNTLVALLFSIELVKLFQQLDVMRWESVIKICVKYGIAAEFIAVAPTLLNAIYLKAANLITTLGGSMSIKDTVGEKTVTKFVGSSFAQTAMTALESNGVIEKMVKSASLGDALGLLVTSSVIVLAIKICAMLIKVIAFGRMFEIAVYVAVSPIPMAFFPQTSGSGEIMSRTTSRFLKSFAAVCLQGVMMIVVFKIFDGLIGGAIVTLVKNIVETSTGDELEKVTEVVFTLLMGSVALVMAITKCNSWAKAILDA